MGQESRSGTLCSGLTGCGTSAEWLPREQYASDNDLVQHWADQCRLFLLSSSTPRHTTTTTATNRQPAGDDKSHDAKSNNSSARFDSAKRLARLLLLLRLTHAFVFSHLRLFENKRPGATQYFSKYRLQNNTLTPRHENTINTNNINNDDSTANDSQDNAAQPPHHSRPPRRRQPARCRCPSPGS